MTSEPTELERAKEKLVLLERKIALQEGLPHLHGWKWYKWALEFFESRNKINLLCAANQISKSSTQIRKAIHWATATDLWPALWPGRRPNQAWYLYPSSKQAFIEFHTKWKQFLPTGKYKEETHIDGKLNPYHWKETATRTEINNIYFPNTGFYIFFKSYTQDDQALQTATVDVIFADEEIPAALYEELMFRLSASDGYFHMVFTATMGQEFWRLCMEPGYGEKENLPMATKWTVSMEDCLQYADGSRSPWTKERIAEIVARCSSQEEVLKRVHGKFIISKAGLKYPTFDIKKHLKPDHKLPENWMVFEGVDIGSGKKNHKAAIIFLAVNPGMTKGRVFLGWRGDDVETHAGDVYQKHLDLIRQHNLHPVQKAYDYGAKDFSIIAQRAGDYFQPANKDHTRGEEILNTLFRNDMLIIYDTHELQKLATELMTFRKDTDKTKAKDDLIDALRYTVMLPNWNWSVITDNQEMPAEAETPLTPAQQEIYDRRQAFIGKADNEETQRVEEEFEEWNSAYGYGE